MLGFGNKKKGGLIPSADSSLTAAMIIDEMDDLSRLNRAARLEFNIDKHVSQFLGESKNYSISNFLMPADYHDSGSGHYGTEFNLSSGPGKLKSMYAREPWLFTTTSLISRTLLNVPMVVKDVVSEEILESHPVYDIMKAANAIQDTRSIDYSANVDLITGGNGFIIFNEDYSKAMQAPVEYTNIKMKPDVGMFNLLDHDEVMDCLELYGAGYSGGSQTKVPWEQVVQFKMPNPFNPFFGMSLILAAARPLLLDRHKNEFEMSFYLRGATNSGVIETTEDMTKKRMENLLSTFEQSFTGRRNWWRTLFLPKGAKWVNSGLTMSEMQHLEGLRENRLTLLAVLGVPPMKVGVVQDVNRSTSETQDSTFYENTIIPLAKIRAAGWNNSHIIKSMFPDVYVDPDFSENEAVQGSYGTKGEQLKQVEKVVTVNEGRQFLNLPPLPDARGEKLIAEIGPRKVPGTNLEPMEPGEGGDETRTVITGPSDAEGDDHTHEAEVDDEGNGNTTSTSGESDSHVHQVVDGVVQISNGHSHPGNLSAASETQRRYQKARVKLNAVNSLKKIETKQVGKFDVLFIRYVGMLLDLAEDAFRERRNLGVYFDGTQPERIQIYQNEFVPLLIESMESGFDVANTTSKSFNYRTRKKEFSPTDEQAIEAIRQRSREGNHTQLEKRAIERFKGFDKTQTKQIMGIIEAGLQQGMTEDQIAANFRRIYKEAYPGQSRTIARTEVLSAASQGFEWNHEALKEVFTLVNKQWFHTGDIGSNPDARKGHAAFEDLGEVPSEHLFVNEFTGHQLKYPRDPNGGAKDVINCRCTMVSVIPEKAKSNAGAILDT